MGTFETKVAVNGHADEAAAAKIIKDPLRI